MQKIVSEHKEIGVILLKKVVFALLLALALFCTLAACKGDEEPAPNTPSDPGNGFEDPAPELVSSGGIGGCALTWELYDDGTLYIKGTGEMAEFETGTGSKAKQPWANYAANEQSVTIKKLVVEDGVTSLAEGAFEKCINLETAEISASVSVLSYKCFDRCALLRTVRAKGVSEVHADAFWGCAKLTTVTLGASLVLVEDGAFSEVATQSTKLAVRLAGTEDEWNAAQADEAFFIGEGNDVFEQALSEIHYVPK